MSILITTNISARDISVQMTDELDVAAEMIVSFSSEGWSGRDEDFIDYIKYELESVGPVGNIALRKLGELLIKAAE